MAAGETRALVPALLAAAIGQLVVGRNFPEEFAMAKPKRKLTAAQRRARKRRRKEFMTIFINGKQKRVKRPPTIEGMDVEDFIRENADPIWLHQNEMWEYIGEVDES